MGRCLGTCGTAGAGLRTNWSSFTAIAKASDMTRRRFAGSTVVTNHSASTLRSARLVSLSVRVVGRSLPAPSRQSAFTCLTNRVALGENGQRSRPTEDWRAARGAMSQVGQAHEEF